MFCLKSIGGKNPLIKFCNKILYLPLPNYSSRFVLWKAFISSHSFSKITDDLDISSLAKVSEGYSAGAIAMAVRETLDVLAENKVNLVTLKFGRLIFTGKRTTCCFTVY